MIAFLFWICSAVLALAAVTHLLALIGYMHPLTVLGFLLSSLLTLPMSILAMITSPTIRTRTQGSVVWVRVLSHVPTWAKISFGLLVLYAFVVFFMAISTLSNERQHVQDGNAEFKEQTASQSTEIVALSAVMMVALSLSSMVLYSSSKDRIKEEYEIAN